MTSTRTTRAWIGVAVVLVGALGTWLAYRRGYLPLLCAMGGGAIASLLVASRPQVGFWLAFAAMLLVQSFLGFSPYFEVGSAHFFIADVAALVLLGAFAVRVALLTARNIFTVAFLCLAIFGGFNLASLLRGMQLYGQTAFVAARPYFYVLAPMCYFASFNYDLKTLRRFCLGLTLAAISLSVLALLRWAEIVPMPQTAEAEVWNPLGTRPLTSYEGLPILLAAILLAEWGMQEKVRRISLFVAASAALGTIVFALRHRSLWIAGTIAALVLLLRHRSRMLRRIGIVIPLVVLGLVMGYFLIEDEVGHYADQFDHAISEPFAERSTATWRIESWRILLGRMKPADYLTGQPLGTSLGRVLYGTWREESPHNFYVQNIIFLGVPGAASFVMMLVALVRRLWRSSVTSSDPVLRAALGGLATAILAEAAFFVSYAGDAIFGVLAGVAIGVAYEKRPASMASPKILPAELVPPAEAATHA